MQGTTLSTLIVRLLRTPSSLVTMTTLCVCIYAILSATRVNNSVLLSLCRSKLRQFAGNLPLPVTLRLTPVLDLILFLPSELKLEDITKNMSVMWYFAEYSYRVCRTSIVASSSNVVACRGVRVFIIAEPSMMIASASGSVSMIVAWVSRIAAS